MTEQELKDLSCKLSAISVFRNLLKKQPLISFKNFLDASGELSEKINLFSEFVFSLSPYNNDFSAFLKSALLEDENAYIVSTAKKRVLPSSLCKNAKTELELFTYLTNLTTAKLWDEADYKDYLPEFENTHTNFEEIYEDRLKNVDKYGYGIFSTANMFRVCGDEILPIEAADNISSDSFIGYEEERNKVFENTRALCEGKPAANVLLFGDAGTGKSSTVKACANHFANDGVRLIELRKDQLFSLSGIMGRIADNPLKFIIFIDDLSFNKNDDCFSMLKAALEGSASAKASNAVIYATSNRRHIVKESFSDRETNDDIHRNDTVQELMSLSARFGMTVYFGKPDKALYLSIVHTLAHKHGITIDDNELDIKAEAFALNRGSRSPRAAEQFINSLI